MDITAPLYWWKEFDTYKVGTVANSCSTMHKIADKELTIDDFSHEHLIKDESIPTRIYGPMSMLEITIANLNMLRYLYLQTKDKKYWWQMIQLLPSSYNQKRTVMMNYETLHNIYEQRKNHKLDEWVQFCKIFTDANNIPLPWLITGEDKSDKESVNFDLLKEYFEHHKSEDFAQFYDGLANGTSKLGEDASDNDQVNSDWTEMFVKAGADVLKAIRSGHDETSKWKDSGVNQSGTPNAVTTDNSTLNDDPYSIYKNDISKDKQKVVKLGIGIAPEPIRFVPEDSSEEFIDNVKKQMLEADNEVSRKLGFRVNKNDCKEDTNADDSTGPVTINFDGADLLNAIRASNYSYGIAPKPISLVPEKNTKK